MDLRGKRCESDEACGTGLVCAEKICDDRPLALPLQAAFYDVGYPEGWDTRYSPSAGRYRSADPSVIEAHLRALEYARMRAAIVKWEGPGSASDTRFSALLEASQRSAFRWAVYGEREHDGNPTAAEIRADLDSLRDRYAAHPNFLRLDGRFVVFVRLGTGDDCATVARWAEANTAGAYLVMKVFSGYEACAQLVPGWHQHGASSATAEHLPYGFSISPGFFSASESAPRLSRDLARWKQNVRDMRASGAAFQLVTTFNDWQDGSAVESAEEWSSSSGFGQYLDVLHEP